MEIAAGEIAIWEMAAGESVVCEIAARDTAAGETMQEIWERLLTEEISQVEGMYMDRTFCPLAPAPLISMLRGQRDGIDEGVGLNHGNFAS